jgi:xanthine dehydrogenase accessory factor
MDMTNRVNELLAKGRVFCLATVIESGNPELSAGMKFIVRDDGIIEAGFDTKILDDQVQELVETVLKEKKRRLVEVSDGVHLFLDVFEPEATLLVCGAGHIAIPLAHFATQAGFKVTILDDRADFAHPSRFPSCKVIADDFAPALREIPMNSSTYAVVITRGHIHDVDCLKEILVKQTGYLGLIGSRRRVRFVLQMLGDQGFPEKRLSQVFTPIGVPIGAESPEEIALSIMAEIVCVRRKGFEQARTLRAAVGVDR